MKKQLRGKDLLIGFGVLLLLPFAIVLMILISLGSKLKFYLYDTRFGRCRKCGAKLKGVGFPKNGFQFYKCPECDSQ